MNKLRKLKNNIFSLSAVQVLGARGYGRMLATLIRALPGIYQFGDLRRLDAAMAGLNAFRYRGRRLRFDTAYCDERIRDGSYAFGIVREILIRDCYLKYLPDKGLDKLRTVVDLGANRGMFTVVAGALGERVLSVEANAVFRPVIEHNARINGFDHIEIETAIVGAGACLETQVVPLSSRNYWICTHFAKLTW